MKRFFSYLAAFVLVGLLSFSQVFATPPSNQARYLAFNSITSNSATVSWINGTGYKRIVVLAYDPTVGNVPVTPDWDGALAASFNTDGNFFALDGTVSQKDLSTLADANGNLTVALADNDNIYNASATLRYVVIDIMDTPSQRATAFTNLLSNKQYSVKVFEYNQNADGTNSDFNVNPGTFNNPRQFTTLATIEPPTALQYSTIFGRIASLGWLAPVPAPTAGIDHYELYISRASGEEFSNTDNILADYDGLDIGNQLTFDAYIENIGTYYFKLKTIDANGVSSPFSTEGIFEITDPISPTFTVTTNATNDLLTVEFDEEVTPNNDGSAGQLDPANFNATCSNIDKIITLGTPTVTGNKKYIFPYTVSSTTAALARVDGTDLKIIVDLLNDPGTLVYDRNGNLMDENYSDTSNAMSSATVVVDPLASPNFYSFTSIQKAVDFSVAGDVVILKDSVAGATPYQSIYTENVNVNKAITITDDGGANLNARVTGQWTVTNAALASTIITGLTFDISGTPTNSILLGSDILGTVTIQRNTFILDGTDKAINSIDGAVLNNVVVGGAPGDGNTFTHLGVATSSTAFNLAQSKVTATMAINNNTFIMSNGADYALKFEAAAATCTKQGTLNVLGNTFKEYVATATAPEILTAQGFNDNAIGFVRNYTTSDAGIFGTITIGGAGQSANSFNNYGLAVNFATENMAKVMPTISLEGNSFDTDSTVAEDGGMCDGFTTRFVYNGTDDFTTATLLYPGIAVFTFEDKTLNSLDQTSDIPFNTIAEAITRATNSTADAIHLGKGSYSSDIAYNKAVDLIGRTETTAGITTTLTGTLTLSGILNTYTVSNILFDHNADAVTGINVNATPLTSALTITNSIFNYNNGTAINVTDKTLTNRLQINNNQFFKYGTTLGTGIALADNQITNTGVVLVQSNQFRSITGTSTPWAPTGTNARGIYVSTTNTTGATSGNLAVNNNIFGIETEATAQNQRFNGDAIVFEDAINSAYNMSNSTIIVDQNIFGQERATATSPRHFGIKINDVAAYADAIYKTMPTTIDLYAMGANTISADDIYGAAWYSAFLTANDVKTVLYPSIQNAIKTDESADVQIGEGIYNENVTTLKTAGTPNVNYLLTSLIGAGDATATPIAYCELAATKKITLTKAFDNDPSGFLADTVEASANGVSLNQAVMLVKPSGVINVTGDYTVIGSAADPSIVTVNKRCTINGNADANLVKAKLNGYFSVVELPAGSATNKLAINNFDWTDFAQAQCIVFEVPVDPATSTTDYIKINNNIINAASAGIMFNNSTEFTEINNNIITVADAGGAYGLYFSEDVTDVLNIHDNKITSDNSGLYFAKDLTNFTSTKDTITAVACMEFTGNTNGININSDTLYVNHFGLYFNTTKVNQNLTLGGATALTGNKFTFASATAQEKGIQIGGQLSGTNKIQFNTFNMNGANYDNSTPNTQVNSIDMGIALSAGNNIDVDESNNLTVENNTFVGGTTGATPKLTTALEIYATAGSTVGFTSPNFLTLNKNAFNNAGFMIWFDNEASGNVAPTRLCDYLGQVNLGTGANINTYTFGANKLLAAPVRNGYYTPTTFDNTVTTVYPDCSAPMPPAGDFVSLTPIDLASNPAVPNYVAGYINSTYVEGVKVKFALKNPATVNDLSFVGGTIVPEYTNNGGTTWVALPSHTITSADLTNGYYEVTLPLVTFTDNTIVVFRSKVTDVTGFYRNGNLSGPWIVDLVAPQAPDLAVTYPIQDGLRMQTLSLAVGIKGNEAYTSFQFASRRANGTVDGEDAGTSIWDEATGSYLWWNQASGLYNLPTETWVTVQNINGTNWSHSFTANQTDEYVMYIRAVDAAGNTGTISRTYTIDNNRPRISDLALTSNTTLVVTFNKDVESTQATLPSNYVITKPNSTTVTALSAVLTTPNTVTLTFAGTAFNGVNDCEALLLTVNSELPNGIRDLAGNLLDNSARGADGTINANLNYHQAKCNVPDRTNPYIVSVARKTTSKGGTEATLDNNYLTNASSVTYTVTFNEDVYNTAALDVNNARLPLVAGNFALNTPAGTISSVTTTDNVNFDVTVDVYSNSAAADGVNLYITAGTNIFDAPCSGPIRPFVAQEVYTPQYYKVDRKAPVLANGFITTPTASPLTSWNNGLHSITFDNTKLSDGGSLNSNVQLNFHYSLTGTSSWAFIGQAMGNLSSLDWNVNLAQGVTSETSRVRVMATDEAGNTAPYYQSDEFTLDNSTLTLAIALNNVTLGHNASKTTTDNAVAFTLTFNKPVMNFDVADIAANVTSGIIYDLYTVNTTDNTVFTVLFTGVAGDGTLGITVNKDNFSDLAGNRLLENSVSSVFTIDNTAPTLSSLEFADCNHTTATVTFDEAVYSTNTATGNLTLTTDYTVTEVGGTKPFTSATGSHTAGNATLTLTNTWGAGTFNGSESLRFNIVAAQVYDKAGNVAVANTISKTTSVPVTFTTQPANRTMCEVQGYTTSLNTFAVVVTGTTPTYQWQYNKGTAGAFINISAADSVAYFAQTTKLAKLNVINPPYATFNGVKFRCIVTNNCGNATSNEVTLTVNKETKINTQPVNTTACFGLVANTFTAEAQGQTDYQWQWYNGSWVDIDNTDEDTYPTNAVISGETTATLAITEEGPDFIPSAVYQFRLLVNGTCSTSVTSSIVTLTVTPPATSDAGEDKIVCASSPSVTLAGTIGGSATMGTWNDGGIGGTFTPNANALTVTYTPPTSLTEQLAENAVITISLVTDDPAGSCDAATDAMTLTINPVAGVNAGPDQSVCGNVTVQLDGHILGAATSATWSGNGTFTPNVNTLNAVYTPTVAERAAGIAVVRLTSNDPDGLCGQVYDEVTISILPLPTTYNVTGGLFCENSNITIGVSGSQIGNTYTLYRNDVATNLQLQGTGNALSFFVNLAQQGVYTVKTGNCNFLMNGSVVVNFAPVVNAGADATTCVTTPYTVNDATASNYTSYTWGHNGLGTLTNTNTLTPVYTPAPGDAGRDVEIGLILTSYSGCVNIQDIKVLHVTTVPTVPTVAATNNITNFCGTATTTLTATSTGATGYVWSLNGTVIENQTSATLAVNQTTAGTYNYTVAATNACGPTTAAAIVITVNAAPTVTIEATSLSVCSGQPVTVTASGAATYNWLNGVGEGAVKVLTPTQTMTYTVEGTTANGCKAQAEITITVNPLPVVTTLATAQTSCGAGNVTFTAATTTTGANIEWSLNSNFTNPTAGNTFTTAAPATVYYRATNGSCTSATLTVQGTVNTLVPIAITGPTTGFNGANIQFTTDVAGSTYTWSTTETAATITNGTTRTATINWPTAGIKMVRLDYTDVNGCPAFAEYTVTLASSCVSVTTASITGSNSVCLGQTITLTAVANGTAPYTYAWRKVGSTEVIGSSSTLELNSLTADIAGSYNVSITNACTTVPAVSNNFALTVSPAVTAPTSVTVDRNAFCATDNGNIVLTAIGGTGTTVRWSTNSDFTQVLAQTGATITIASPEATTTYYARWESACGNSASANVQVNVNPATTITLQPTNQVISATNTATFTVTATGDGLSYAWYKENGATDLLVGTNSNTLNLTNLNPTNDYGNLYYVIVTGNCGTATSNTVALASNPTVAPTIAVVNRSRDRVTLRIGNIGGASQGMNALVIAEAVVTGNSIDFTPTDGVAYNTYSLDFGDEPTAVGSTESFVYNGNATQITVVGLDRNTQYRFRVYSYSGVTGTPTTNVYSRSLAGAILYSETVVRTTLKETNDESAQNEFTGSFSVSKVNPNPVHTDMNFSVEAFEQDNFTFELFNVSGEVVLSQSENLNEGSHTMNLNLFTQKGGIAAGTYFLKVSNSTGSLTQQVVVLP